MRTQHKHTVAGIVLAMLLCVVLSGCFLFGHVRSGDSTEYATLLEKSYDGNTPNTYGIFPEGIPGNATAKEFYYESADGESRIQARPQTGFGARLTKTPKQSWK
jgi:hypothetical protein